jgi:hypothetical protein
MVQQSIKIPFEDSEALATQPNSLRSINFSTANMFSIQPEIEGTLCGFS